MAIRGTVAATILVASAACSGQTGTQAALPTLPTSSPVSIERYGVLGTVHDSAGRPIRAATVTVVTGPQAGVVTTTDEAGKFTFSDVTGLATIRAQKAGLVEQAKALYTYPLLEPGMATVWFRLESATRPPINLAGTYSLTYSADSACAAALPEVARTRTYTTALGTTGSSGQIMLTGARFDYGGAYSYWNVIYFGLFEDFASLYFEDPPIRERLGQGSTLEIYGHAYGTITSSSTEFAVTGSFRSGDAICRSTNHRLVVLRTAS